MLPSFSPPRDQSDQKMEKNGKKWGHSGLVCCTFHLQRSQECPDKKMGTFWARLLHFSFRQRIARVSPFLLWAPDMNRSAAFFSNAPETAYLRRPVISPTIPIPRLTAAISVRASKKGMNRVRVAVISSAPAG